MREELLKCKRRALCLRLAELPGNRTPARLTAARRIYQIDGLLAGRGPIASLTAARDLYQS